MSQPATWTATGTQASSSNLVVTHAAVADKSHYICGIIVSSSYKTNGIGNNMDILVQEDVGGGAEATLLQFSYTSASQKEGLYWDGSAYAPIGYTGGDGCKVINFSSPIRCTEGKSISVTSNPDGAISVHDANIWGFTATDRADPA